MPDQERQSSASESYLALVASRTGQLAERMRMGEPPDVAALSGWEWRGANMPATSRLLGIRRFVKGFAEVEGRLEGYNVSVTGSDLLAPWTERPQRDGRREWARFGVTPVDPLATDNRHPRAVLLDYGVVADPERGLARRLRDYLVRASPGSDDLLLGQAFLAVGSGRVPVGWFALERLRPIRTV